MLFNHMRFPGSHMRDAMTANTDSKPPKRRSVNDFTAPRRFSKPATKEPAGRTAYLPGRRPGIGED